LKTAQGLQVTARPAVCSRTRRGRDKRIIVVVLAILVLSLAGCGRQGPAYWPDLAVDADAGIVYVAEANGQVFALTADSGKVVWSYPSIEERSGGLLGGCSARATDGPFYAAPVFSDEHVFLGSAGEQQRSLLSKGENRAGLRVLNRLGTPQWEFKGASDRTVASPALAGSTVYLPSSDRNVYAIDVNTRQARWVFSTQSWVWAAPLVVEDKVYIASMDHVLYAVSDESGQEAWRFDAASSALPATPAFAKDVLYLGSLDGHVYAIHAQTGVLEWEQIVDGGIWATPLIQNDVLYFGTLGGEIYALSAVDGAKLWEKSVEGEVRGTPAYVNGTLYVGCENGQLYAFDAQTGAPGISPLGKQLERASIHTSPVFDGQHLYIVATDGQVLALDLQEDEIVWQRNPLSKDGEEE